MEEVVDTNEISAKPSFLRGLEKFPSWLKSKYLITGLLFLVWMLFFDTKDILSGFAQKSKLSNLQKSEQHLTKQIAETGKELDLLKTNAQTIEKYARENYLMKKDNEDIFIVDNTVENKQ
ncbi:MAG: septum formation initiator family protein [Chitinophagaceae bacterium]|nr:septum formation initiator family protein [Chitinophagaceae bacterium]